VAWDDSRPVLSYKTVWEKTVQSVKELLPLAEELKVAIALENVWNRFLISPMEWKLFLDQFTSKKVGIYFDLANCCIYCRPQDYIEILQEKVMAIHVKNFAESDCAGGLHGFGDDLLEGMVDFAAVQKSLEAINYQGALTAEMVPFSRLPDMVLPDEELAVKTCKTLKTLFN
jgi:hexulose-6-phosphate isomerase